jgi:hypothetical protein
MIFYILLYNKFDIVIRSVAVISYNNKHECRISFRMLKVHGHIWPDLFFARFSHFVNNYPHILS